MGTGLRERKKQRTRETIIRAALALFEAKGFDGATVADIAEAADIAPRTFFEYFPAKEDVVFHDFDARASGFAERVRTREPGEPALDVLRTWILELVEAKQLDSEEERVRHRLVRETPSLAARERSNLARIEDVLAGAIATDLGVGEDSLRPHLASAAALAALTAIARQRDEAGEAIGDAQAIDALDEALAFANGGLAALRRLPS